MLHRSLEVWGTMEALVEKQQRKKLLDDEEKKRRKSQYNAASYSVIKLLYRVSSSLYGQCLMYCVYLNQVKERFMYYQ